MRCSDRDAARVELLNSGETPIFEEGLQDFIRTGLAGGHLAFRTDNTWAIEGAEFTILRIPTPEGPDGWPDMSFIETVAIEVGRRSVLGRWLEPTGEIAPTPRMAFVDDPTELRKQVGVPPESVAAVHGQLSSEPSDNSKGADGG